MTDFFIKVRTQLEQHLPFVIYSKPGSKIMTGVFQRNDHLYTADAFAKSGFIMAPFAGPATIIFPDSESETVKVVSNDTFKFADSPMLSSPDETSENLFTGMVQKAVDQIKLGLFAKVVLSRYERIALSDFDVEQVYSKLFSTYDDAFTYCWYHPKVGMWLGATPEQLVRSDGRKFSSVALAGTKQVSALAEDEWEQKEQDEQQFVTDYIIDNLQHVSSELVISSPYTAQAGKLLHIKTDINGVLKPTSKLDQVVAVLHPTPAVCGVPKKQAIEFILQNETFDREFYTGFLGEFSINDGESDLYVNLRCMQYKDGAAYIYAGCGITIDSDPVKEYEETANKMLTIKKIL